MAAAMFLTTRVTVPTAVGSKQPSSVRLPKMSALKAQGRRAALVCTAHGHGGGHGHGGSATAEHGHGHGMAERPRPGEKKGFVEEMRFVAMKLHTKEQAPKEGQAEMKEEQQKAMKEWAPTREGYLSFLAESKVMYEALESIVAEAPHESYKVFQNTGLERVAALEKDIAFFKDTYNLTPETDNADGPGGEYAVLLKKLAAEDPPAFICHFYNVYFAHSAGGRMIGTKMSDMLLDGAKLQFYAYDGEMKDLLQVVKDNLNTVAEEWTREQKDHCLKETEVSFKMSGQVLRMLFAPPSA